MLLYKNKFFVFIISLSICFLIELCSCIGNIPNLKITKTETFFNNLSREPENLHPIKSTDYYSSVIQSYILESLLQRNADTNKWESQLAKKWKISPDGETFTFELFDNLKWSDGKALTAYDVKFSLEAFKNPKYGGIRYIPYFENMKSAKVLSPTKIEFKVKSAYFGNFQVISGMYILPKHIYKDPKTKLSKTVIGSGPYLLEHYIRGKILVLTKNPSWQGKQNPKNNDKWKFKRIAFRFIKTETDTLLRMEKNNLDFSFLNPQSFFEKTKHPPWNDKIKKIQYINKEPKGYGFIGFNFKKSLFQDKRTRKALAHLLNRELINKKFLYKQSELAKGPWYFWSDFADPSVKALKYDPKQAQHILKSAGWADRDKNGILEKTINGKKKEFAFTILFANSDNEKYLTLYQEDLKKSGIKLSLKILDWTSFLRLIDDKTFDAVHLGWGAGSIDFDPKQIWHTKSSQKNGSNFISYSNPKVDALIDKAQTQMNRQKRIKTFQMIYKTIAEDVPYIFMFNSRSRFYGVNKRIYTPKDSFNYDLGQTYWNLKSDL